MVISLKPAEGRKGQESSRLFGLGLGNDHNNAIFMSNKIYNKTSELKNKEKSYQSSIQTFSDA